MTIKDFLHKVLESVRGQPAPGNLPNTPAENRQEAGAAGLPQGGPGHRSHVTSELPAGTGQFSSPTLPLLAEDREKKNTFH